MDRLYPAMYEHKINAIYYLILGITVRPVTRGGLASTVSRAYTKEQ